MAHVISAQGFADAARELAARLPEWRWRAARRVGALDARLAPGWLELERAEEAGDGDAAAEEAGDDLLAAPYTPPAVRFTHRIVWHPSYRVPVMLLRAAGAGGVPLARDDVVARLPDEGRALAADAENGWAFLADLEDPHSGELWLALHPCRTAEALSAMLDVPTTTAAAAPRHELRYLAAWLTLAGPPVGLPLGPGAFLALVA